jgi:hypothetical protein
VAAIDRRIRRALRRRRRFSRRIPWLAAGVGALAARDAPGQSLIDTRFLFYKESGGRTQVFNPVLFVQQDLGETYGQLGLILGYDAISGASPTGAYPTSDVTTSASGHLIQSGAVPTAQYRDKRKSVSLSYGRRFGAHLPTVDLSYAKENDYTARSVGLSDAWTMAGGLGTLHFGVSLSRDIVAPVTNHLRLPKSENGYSLGWTQVLGERDLIDVSASLMQLSGYLDDPYKVVPIGTPDAMTTLPEHRPDTRSRRALVVKYGHEFLWNGAVKASYRYYNDSWSIQAHLLDVVYDQRVGEDEDWIVSPEVRLYTQTGARFYGGIFSAAQTNMSADYRLSPLDSILGGLTITHKIGDALSANLGATIQSQRGRDRIILPSSNPEVGPASISGADMSVVTVTAGFTWRY